MSRIEIKDKNTEIYARIVDYNLDIFHVDLFEMVIMRGKKFRENIPIERERMYELNPELSRKPEETLDKGVIIKGKDLLNLI